MGTAQYDPRPNPPHILSLSPPLPTLSATLYWCRGGVCRSGASLTCLVPRPRPPFGGSGRDIRGWKIMKTGEKAGWRNHHRAGVVKPARGEECPNAQKMSDSRKDLERAEVQRIISLHEQLVNNNSRVQKRTPREFSTEPEPCSADLDFFFLRPPLCRSFSLPALISRDRVGISNPFFKIKFLLFLPPV